MRIKHTVKLKSGAQEIYNFNNKKASDKALENAFKINKTFNTISHILIEPISHPNKWEKITFKNGEIVEWIDCNSQAREEFNKEYNVSKQNNTK